MLVPILRILEDFLDVMNTHCHKLCDNILEPVAGCGQEFDVFPMVYLFKWPAQINDRNKYDKDDLL